MLSSLKAITVTLRVPSYPGSQCDARSPVGLQLLVSVGKAPTPLLLCRHLSRIKGFTLSLPGPSCLSLEYDSIFGPQNFPAARFQQGALAQELSGQGG